MILFVASMEVNWKINLTAHLVFGIFKFTTSDNLIGWEAMPDNANPKKSIFVVSMDI